MLFFTLLFWFPSFAYILNKLFDVFDELNTVKFPSFLRGNIPSCLREFPFFRKKLKAVVCQENTLIAS